MVSALGCERGVRWTTTWREGCVVRRGEVRRVEEEFERVLEAAC
jgi:hypothetical protein